MYHFPPQLMVLFPAKTLYCQIPHSSITPPVKKRKKNTKDKKATSIFFAERALIIYILPDLHLLHLLGKPIINNAIYFRADLLFTYTSTPFNFPCCDSNLRICSAQLLKMLQTPHLQNPCALQVFHASPFILNCNPTHTKYSQPTQKFKKKKKTTYTISMWIL